MNKQLQIAILLAGSTLVSGCQLFQSNTARLQAGLRMPEQVDAKAFAQEQLEAGRTALAQGNFAAAVAAFRNAALEPEFAAPAHNGLGIAYAGMGRNDIAERYFRWAIAEDPTVTRYQDNLVRLQRVQFAAAQERLARAKPVPTLPLRPVERTLPGTALRASLAVTTPTARVAPAAGGGFRVGSTVPLTPQRLPTRRSAGDALPVVGSYQPAASEAATSTPTRTDPAKPDLAKPATVKPEVASAAAATPVAKPTTVIVPQTETQRPAVAIQTTGRRIPPAEFASIFAPYSGGERQPIVAAVSSPGLRSSALPEPTFGKPPAPQPVADMALSGE